MPSRPSRSPIQKLARERLLSIHEATGSWAGVFQQTGINKGRAWKICKGKSRASSREIGLLDLHLVKKPRTPWKKKYLLLRKFITTRRIS